MTKHLLLPGILAAIALASAGCGTSEDDPTATSSETVSEIAAGTVSGTVAASDNGGSGSVALRESNDRRSLLARFDDLVQLFPSAFAATTTTCPAANLTNCASGVITANYGTGCSPNGHSAVTWTGSQTVTFKSPNGSCPALGHMFDSGNDFIRAFGAGTTRQAGNGVMVTFDTAVPLGEANLTGVTGVTGGGTEIVMGASGARTVMINGIHYTATKTVTTNKGNTKVKTVWDHIVDTPAALSITKSGTTHTVNSGTVRVQHMLAKYVATAVLSGVTYDTSTSCCHPTAGTLTTTYTDSTGASNEEILKFQSTSTNCGAATLQTGTGTSAAAADTAAQAATATSITLNHCF